MLLVSACDKLHNAHCTVADLREYGPSFWERFNAGPADQRWYYATLLEVFRRRFADDPAGTGCSPSWSGRSPSSPRWWIVQRSVTGRTNCVGGSGTTCPSCGEGDARPIIWGMPSPELMEAAEAGLIDVALGGCCVTEDDPTHECRACGRQFRDERDLR